jgi:hypothetical protein
LNTWRINIKGTIDKRNYLQINFVDANKVGIIFGIILSRDFCFVPIVVYTVKRLFKKNIDNFNFVSPSNEKIRVEYVPQPIHGIRISWDSTHNQEGQFAGINQAHKDNIFLTYPLIGMNAKQLLTHELGHWYFNRLIENLISADDRHICREDIDGYETNFSERAAHYCEIKLAGKRKKYTEHDNSLITNIEQIEQQTNNVLQTIRNQCINRWERQLKTNNH